MVTRMPVAAALRVEAAAEPRPGLAADHEGLVDRAGALVDLQRDVVDRGDLLATEPQRCSTADPAGDALWAEEQQQAATGEPQAGVVGDDRGRVVVAEEHLRTREADRGVHGVGHQGVVGARGPGNLSVRRRLPGPVVHGCCGQVEGGLDPQGNGAGREVEGQRHVVDCCAGGVDLEGQGDRLGGRAGGALVRGAAGLVDAAVEGQARGQTAELGGDHGPRGDAGAGHQQGAAAAEV